MTNESPSARTTQKQPSDSDPLRREKLPKDLQNLVDDQETLFDQIYDGK